MDRMLSRTTTQNIAARPMKAPASPPMHATRVAGAVLPPMGAPKLSLPELGAAAREIGGSIAAGSAALTAAAISDAIVERTSLSEGSRAIAQGLALGAAGAVVSMTGARTAGRGLIAAAVVSSGFRYARARQWDRAIGGWIARTLGTQRREERAGAGVWGDDPEIRVEAMTNG